MVTVPVQDEKMIKNLMCEYLNISFEPFKLFYSPSLVFFVCVTEQHHKDQNVTICMIYDVTSDPTINDLAFGPVFNCGHLELL